MEGSKYRIEVDTVHLLSVSAQLIGDRCVVDHSYGEPYLVEEETPRRGDILVADGSGGLVVFCVGRREARWRRRLRREGGVRGLSLAECRSWWQTGRHYGQRKEIVGNRDWRGGGKGDGGEGGDLESERG